MPVPVTTAGVLAGKNLTQIRRAAAAAWIPVRWTARRGLLLGSNYDGALGDGSTAGAPASRWP